MDTKELLQLYKTRWNEINKANNHGNITIQRSHTQLLSLTAQTIEHLMMHIIELESRLESKPKAEPNMSEVDKIMAASGIKK